MKQYRFRPGHSTELAVARLVDYLISQMDNYCTPTNVYIDLSKAFNTCTLNHNILLSRLQYYGITGCPNDLLCSYLSGRSQYVNTVVLNQKNYLLILGCLKVQYWDHYSFLYNINDLPLVSNVLKIVMYADDTTLFCNIDNNVTEDVINRELLKIYEWLGANKLALNVSKTKFMVFHTRNKSVSYPSLKINGKLIERVTQFNFLGLILESNMSWNLHINHISPKNFKGDWYSV